MKLSRRAVGATVAILLLAGFAFVLLRPAPVAVEIATVQRGSFRVTVDEEGYTRVRNRYVVTAPIAGRVARIDLESGDSVQRGAVVARMAPLPLDPRTRAEAEASLAAAKAAKREADVRVEHARAALEQAQRTTGRAERLGARGAISKEEREQAELDRTARQKEYDAAVFAVHAAEANVEAARAALMLPGTESDDGVAARCEANVGACIDIHSPIDGAVLRVPEKSERVVGAGTELMELGDPNALEIVVDVLSADAVKVKPGDLMLVEDWGGGQIKRARVRVVEPSGFTKVSALGVEEQRVNLIADFVGPSSPLADGYRVETRTVVWQGKDVLKIPSGALFRRQGQWNVFTVEDGRARLRTVEIGHRNNEEAEVLKGLDAGAKVILYPSDRVEEGVRVLRTED